MYDMGLLKYDDLVTKYWPEFGKHGKDNVTIAMLMSHQAGLAAIDKALTYGKLHYTVCVYCKYELCAEDIADADKLSAIFENQKPNWPPGTATGYHALTHGWLAAQLVRRIDPQKRTLGQFFQEEIMSKTGLNITNDTSIVSYLPQATRSVSLVYQWNMVTKWPELHQKALWPV
jgi:CubicO group peptidase (beta-lactamase class C family)